MIDFVVCVLHYLQRNILCISKKLIKGTLSLALLLADSSSRDGKDKKKPKKTKEPLGSTEEDWSDDKYYWETSSETKSSAEYLDNYLSLNGRLRRQFAFSLFLQNPTANGVCSPVSALMPLGKLVIGASGTNRKELLAAIGVNKLSEANKHFTKLIKDLQSITGVTIGICSSVYINKNNELKREFKKTAKEVFGISVEKIDFSNPKRAVDKINAWVSKQTKGKIHNLLADSDVTPSSTMVLVNAIYFSGNWLYPFERATKGIFNSPHGKQNALMMHLTQLYKFYESTSLDAKIVEIPYNLRSKSSLVIALPKSKDTTSLLLLLKALKVAPDLLKDAIKKMTYRKVSLTIPKFTIESKLDLNEEYKNIGLYSMYKKGFKNIVEGTELFISKAVQAAIIQVDENGTLAAAATATTLLTATGPVNIVEFTADHPFFFILKVRDQQLFAGVFTDFLT